LCSLAADGASNDKNTRYIRINPTVCKRFQPNVVFTLALRVMSREFPSSMPGCSAQFFHYLHMSEEVFDFSALRFFSAPSAV